MGRPPSNGSPAFRFTAPEVTEMEAILQEHNNAVPNRDELQAIADKFSASAERAGKIVVQMKQVWNWFQNKRYALRSKSVKSPVKLNTSQPAPREDLVVPVRNIPQPLPPPPSVATNVGKSVSDASHMEFEAKSARDGAWYDVATFHSHRYLDTGDPEALVRFSGFGPEEDEWVNIRKHIRQRSLPCEASECVAVLPGDLILCFQEGKEQALYFDAHVIDAQRRRHDVRGCRCRFLVHYDHDQSEEIVPLKKVCRRPETDYRLQQLHAINDTTPSGIESSKDTPSKSTAFPPEAMQLQRLPPSNANLVGPTGPASHAENANLVGPDSHGANIVGPMGPVSHGNLPGPTTNPNPKPQVTEGSSISQLGSSKVIAGEAATTTTGNIAGATSEFSSS